MNMKAFVSFIRELCQASQEQLSAYSHYSDLHGPGCPSIPNNALHLYRLGDVLMRCVDSDRPMIHVMKAWSAAVPHLVDVSKVMFSFFTFVSVVVIDLPLLRVAVEGSDSPVSLEKPCQASLPPDQQGRHSLGRHPEVQYVA